MTHKARVGYIVIVNQLKGNEPMNNIIIDIKTRDKRKALTRLNALKSTVLASDGGEYHQDRSYSQILIETSKTEEELENWLYKSNLDYVGVFQYTS